MTISAFEDVPLRHYSVLRRRDALGLSKILELLPSSGGKIASSNLDDLENQIKALEKLVGELSRLLEHEDVKFPQWLATWESKHSSLSVTTSKSIQQDNERCIAIAD